MAREEYVYLKKDHTLYGEKGRAIKKTIYADLPNEHRRLFVTERTYRNKINEEIRRSLTDAKFTSINIIGNDYFDDAIKNEFEIHDNEL